MDSARDELQAHDPLLDVVLDAMHGVVARMPIEDRAVFCCLSDEQRGQFLLTLIARTSDSVTDAMLNGVA